VQLEYTHIAVNLMPQEIAIHAVETARCFARVGYMVGKSESDESAVVDTVGINQTVDVHFQRSSRLSAAG